MFDNIEYTEDIEEMRKWIPLMMEGHSSSDIMAASKINEGTDVNFGELTRKMAKNIEQHPNANVQYNHEVIDFNHRKMVNGKLKCVNVTAVMFKLNLLIMYIGAGGGAIPLLQKLEFQKVNIWADSLLQDNFLICTNLEPL